MTLKQGIELYLTYCELRSRRAQTINRNRHILERFAEHATSKGIVYISELRLSHLGDYIAALRSSHTGRTRWTITSIVNHFLNWCSRHGYANPGELPRPFRRIERLPTLRVPLMGDVAATLRSSSPGTTIIVGILAFSGVRGGELSVVEIDLDGDWVIVNRGKLGASRKIPLHPRLRALITEARDIEKFLVSRSAVRKARVQVADAGHIASLHALRHFFQKVAVESGVPPRVVAAWMGHRPSNIQLSDEESQRYMRMVRFDSDE